MSEIPFRDPGRRTPAKGVHVSLGGSNWVFLTVCTEKRDQWLAQASVQRTLHDIWERTATAWLVSDYLLMPDHLHLFCAPPDQLRQVFNDTDAEVLWLMWARRRNWNFCPAQRPSPIWLSFTRPTRSSCPRNTSACRCEWV